MSLPELIVSLVLVVSTTFTSYCIKNAKPPELFQFNTPTVRSFMVMIENVENGAVSIIRAGRTQEIGMVVRPAFQAERAPDHLWSYHYLGATNGSKGAVVGSGANTIDIKCGPSRDYDPFKPTNWLASIISIIPFTEEESSTPNDMVVTCPGGSDIFNKWSPYVGNPVYALENGVWIPIDSYFVSPTRVAPSMILIDVRKPKLYVPYVELENWVRGDTIKGETMTDDGGVWVSSQSGEKSRIARVLQRVTGTGSFQGSEYAEVGQVRIATPGMIEISTNRWKGRVDDPEDRASFEILAENEAKFLHHNLGFQSIIGGSPYLIIGPIDSSPDDLKNKEYTDDDGLLLRPTAGLPPLFNGFVRPHFEIDNFEASFRSFISEDFGRTWRAMPEVAGVVESDDSPIRHWTNIRLMMGR